MQVFANVNWKYLVLATNSFLLLQQSCISTGGITLLQKVLLGKQRRWDFFLTSHSVMAWGTGSQHSAMRAQVNNCQQDSLACLNKEKLNRILIEQMENQYSCSQTKGRWSGLQAAWKIGWIEGLKWQHIWAQKISIQLLSASSVQGLVLLNAFINDQDNEIEHTLSTFVDDALQDRDAVKESYQSCYISILTTALRCSG